MPGSGIQRRMAVEASEIMMFIRDEAHRKGITQAEISEKTYRTEHCFSKTLRGVKAGHGVYFSTIQDFLRVVGYEMTIQPIKEET